MYVIASSAQSEFTVVENHSDYLDDFEKSPLGHKTGCHSRNQRAVNYKCTVKIRSVRKRNLKCAHHFRSLLSYKNMGIFEDRKLNTALEFVLYQINSEEYSQN